MNVLEISKKIKSRMYYRVFLTYSIIIFITMAALFVLLWQYYSDFIIQKETARHELILKEVKMELAAKHQFVKQGINQLYLEKNLFEDLMFVLKNDYNDYLRYRLDKFSKSDSFSPYNFDIFVKNYFSRDTDIIAVEICNNGLDGQCKFLYDRSKWKNKHKKNKNIKDLSAVYRIDTVINDPITLKPMGMLTVYFSYRFIDQVLDTYKEPIIGSITIKDKSLKQYYSYGKDQKVVLKYGSTELENKQKGDYCITSSVEPVSKLMISAVVPMNEIKQLTIYKYKILGIIMALTVFTIGLPYFSLKDYFKKVDHIVEVMKKAQTGDMQVKIEQNHIDDDLDIIAVTFNETLEKLQEYIEKEYDSRLKQKEAELVHLQSQINPHFLYNTLEAIRMKAIAEGGKTSAKMIVKLSQLFRLSLKNTDWVTVEEELYHAQQYLDLFMMRFPDQLKTTFHVSYETQSYCIIPFVLQPLIENFVLHGLRPATDDNVLTIGVRVEKKQLLIEITDNGMGIEADRLAEIQKRLQKETYTQGSIGLFNVNQRIRLKFGAPYGVAISSMQGIFTKVTVRIPALLDEV